jgi:hypothetical protein
MDNTHNFAILTNGIDSNIEIIQHIETGYYNIAKTAKLVADLKNTKCKNIPDFLRLDSTKELIEECKKYTNTEEIYYELKKDIPTKFAGTYIHKYLYNQFVSWLDKSYGLKISIILEQIHKDANIKLIADHKIVVTGLESKLDDSINENKLLIIKYAEEAKLRDEEAKKLAHQRDMEMKLIKLKKLVRKVQQFYLN